MPPKSPAGMFGMNWLIRSWWYSFGGPPVILVISGAKIATMIRNDDERPTCEGHLVAAEPAPRDLAERAPLDLLLTGGHGGIGSVH